MQQLRQSDQEDTTLVGWGARVLLLSQGNGGRIAERLLGLGSRVEAEQDEFAAIELLQCDGTGFGLFVMDCDPFGGLEAGRRVMSMLGRVLERTPCILISAEVTAQTFPDEAWQPILLRSPLSAVALRVGFEHALRERLIYLAA